MFSEPAVGERFFGREEVLEILDKRVSALKDGYRQNVALTGQSLAGKTSVLHHFLRSIKDEDFITVYVEVVKEPFATFADRFIATLLYNALLKTGEDAGFRLDGLIDSAAGKMPGTHAAIRHVYSLIDRGDRDAAYLALLGLTSVVKDEVKISCVVILDEFDNLEHIGVKNPFLNFGKVIMIQKDTMYIVSSSRNQIFKKILSEKLSLLFGNFEIVKLCGFDAREQAAFIDSRLGEFEMDAALKKFLATLTDGNPFYLDNLVKAACGMARQRMTNYIGADTLARALVAAIYEPGGAIYQYLTNFILELLDARERDRYLEILTSIARGRNRVADISKYAKAKQSVVSKDLAELSQLGLISKYGTFYRIEDAMLGFWLDNVHRRKKELLVDGIFNRSDIFAAHASAYISDFMREALTDIAQRLGALFSSFSNELIQIDSKQLRLPHFTKVETGVFAGGTKYVAATFRGNTWIAGPYAAPVTENDIVEFVRNSKQSPYKISNRIVMPLAGIDENAKLLAKELKISIWDLATLNNIFGIYGKGSVCVI
jgi:AAA+ ATPase superfamily predicted ATPase